MRTLLLCCSMALLTSCASARSGPAVKTDRSQFQLTAEEKQRASEAAKRALDQQNLRGTGRVYVVAVQMADEKTETGERANTRLALVTQYRYEDDAAIETLVDASNGRVLQTRVLKDVPAPLAEEEFAEAKKLALAKPEVRQALPADLNQVKIEPLLTRSSSSADRLWHHRVVRLLFRVERGYLTTPIVLVDLTTREVIIEQPPARVP